MTTTQEFCRLLPWDSQFFGRRLARADLANPSARDLRAIESWAREQRVDCVTLLTDATGGTSAETLHAFGYRLVDLRLELARALPAESAAGTATARPVRAYRPDDLSALQRIARAAHRHTRFFKDARFPAERAVELYAEWIRRDCELSTVWVAEEGDGEPLGYLSCFHQDGTGWISLLAVDEAHTGRGIGRALVQRALAWAAAAGCGEMRVVTQGDNVSAQQAYQAAGFRTARAQAWFHQWFAPAPAA